jgi:alpha-tubulin suppressor-like RCC1 family protein
MDTFVDPTTDASGAFEILTSTTAASITVRVVAPATTINGVVHPTVTSSTRKLSLITQKVTLKLPTTVYVGQPATATVTLSPAQSFLGMQLLVMMKGSWTAVGPEVPVTAEAPSLTLQIQFVPEKSGRFTYAAQTETHLFPVPSVRSSKHAITVKAATAAPLLVRSASLRAGGLGAAYTTTLQAYGGRTPYKWSASGLPKGLAITTGGSVSGTPAKAGSFTAKVTVADSVGHKATAKLPLTIGADPARTAVQVVAGSESSCVLTANGAVSCWGSNLHGQLGNGSGDSSVTPVRVLGLDAGVTAIAGAEYTTCALLADGTVSCWGEGILGELGNGGTATQTTPVKVADLGGVRSISAGSDHFCAVNGAAECWGSNDHNQLQSDGGPISAVPVMSTGWPNTILAVTAGGHHTCAYTENNDLLCWGSNASGELGRGWTSDADQGQFPADLGPVAVAGLAAGGGFTCLVATGGVAECWGLNDAHQLGIKTTDSSPAPAPVAGVGAVLSLSVSSANACAVTLAGGVSCWGSIASGDFKVPNHPPKTVISKGVQQVGAGPFHSCVVTRAGGVKCWGENHAGEVGVPTTASTSKPVTVPAFG